MQITYQAIGIVAGALAIGGYIPYIYSTIKGTTIPNKATWFIWTLVGGLLCFSYMAAGDPHAIWLPLGYFIGPLIICILTLRYGYSEWTRLDKICVLAAIISIIPWLLSKNPNFTLLINILIDCVGAIPTIIKTYHEPETEDYPAWVIFFAANTIQLFAIEIWNLSAIYPVYLFFLAGLIVLFITMGKVKNKLVPGSKKERSLEHKTEPNSKENLSPVVEKETIER